MLTPFQVFEYLLAVAAGLLPLGLSAWLVTALFAWLRGPAIDKPTDPQPKV